MEDVDRLKDFILSTHQNEINNRYLLMSFQEYFRLFRGYLISNKKKYSNVDLLKFDPDKKTILVANGGIFRPNSPSIIFKPQQAKIHFFVKFKEESNRIVPITYGLRYYVSNTLQFRFDKEEQRHDFSHPNCHLTFGENRTPRIPTPNLDLFNFLFLIENM